MSINKKVAVVIVSLVLLMAASLPVLADGAQVTQGDFASFASGPSLGYDVAGQAKMVRTADGRTFVTVHVSGMHEGVAYGAHIHNMPCDVNNGGGHYQHVVGGPVDPINEIWPGFTANAAGIGNGGATNDYSARPEAQSVVVHDPNAGNARIACADLN